MLHLNPVYRGSSAFKAALMHRLERGNKGAVKHALGFLGLFAVFVLVL